MIQLGTYQELQANRKKDDGWMLMAAGGFREVWLPNELIIRSLNPGDSIKVFVYKNTEGQLVGTTENVFIQTGQFASLQVQEINQHGAWMDWGIADKQLFVPFKNMSQRMEEGRDYLVYLYVDQSSDRLVGTTKLDAYLKDGGQHELRIGDEVEVLIWAYSDLGIKAIINQTYRGLLYKNEVFEKLKIGQQRKAYIKQIRPDQKIDLSLHPPGYAAVEPHTKKLLNALQQANGFLPLHDKSAPERIREELEMSKKVFKKSVGALYRQGLIRIESDGIYLTEPA